MVSIIALKLVFFS